MTSPAQNVEPHIEGPTMVGNGEATVSATGQRELGRPPLTRRESLALERAKAALLASAAEATPGAMPGPDSDVQFDAATDARIVDAPPALSGRRALRHAERAADLASEQAAAPAVTLAMPHAGRSDHGLDADSTPPTRKATASAAPRRKLSGRRRTQRAGVAAAMFFVGATLVSTSVPANAYFVDTPEHAAVKLAAAAQSGRSVGGSSIGAADSQQLRASSSVKAESVGRDGYSVSALAPASSGSSSSFSNDINAAVQWPFASSVPISSGFGGRQIANCGFCSTNHQGLDFVPGAGTPIQSIADGVVSRVELGGGAFGYNVWIDHVVEGQKITTVSAHMQAGSVKVAKGQSVKVGQVIGLVGSTGNSTGAHLHFEVHLGTRPIDPYPWLMAHAGVA